MAGYKGKLAYVHREEGWCLIWSYLVIVET